MDDETSPTGMLSSDARNSLLREETSKTRHQFEADSHEESATYVTRQAFEVADRVARNGIDHRAILMAASQSAREAYQFGLHMGRAEVEDRELEPYGFPIDVARRHLARRATD